MRWMPFKIFADALNNISRQPDIANALGRFLTNPGSLVAQRFGSDLCLNLFPDLFGQFIQSDLFGWNYFLHASFGEFALNPRDSLRRSHRVQLNPVILQPLFPAGFVVRIAIAPVLSVTFKNVVGDFGSANSVVSVFLAGLLNQAGLVLKPVGEPFPRK